MGDFLTESHDSRNCDKILTHVRFIIFYFCIANYDLKNQTS